ncbi:MAG: CGNR zinc finger domain-containing protein [Sciscionella sp.]|nr:CGNR zinc finger domain-containing protein [Sciscionella sp.]
MSSITLVPITGDVRLARLLASAASCGWRGRTDLERIARRCEWPPRLRASVAKLPDRQLAALVRASHTIWRVFASPADRAGTLRGLIGQPRLCLDDAEPPRLACRAESAGRALTLTAALGLADILATHGDGSLDVCAQRYCTQPVLRIGRNSRSTACSPECANRARVARHRAKRQT